MDHLVGRHFTLDGIEKADEFLLPVALHAAPDDFAFQDIEGGEQGGGAVALVVVGHGGAASFLHRQTGLGAIRGLDLALLKSEHDGVGWRIDIEADHLLELLGEFGIVGELERATRCGWSQCPFQMRRTEEGLTPSPWPSPARSQWVASCGGA